MTLAGPPSDGPDRSSTTGRLRRFGRDDRGGVAGMVVLFPLFAVVVFMFVQTMLWQRARELAAAAADEASSAIALYDAAPGGARADLEDTLRRVGLRDVTVSVTRTASTTVVEASGDAPGIIVGTSVRVHARSVTPTDRFTSP